MKRRISFTVLFVLMMLATGLLKGQSVVKETRDLSGFTRVSFGVSGELYINTGAEFKVVLEGEKALLEDIVTKVDGGKLVIKKENWRMNMNDKVMVYITMPDLKGLGVSGSGKAWIKDIIKADDIDLSVSGSGKLIASGIFVKNLGCSISGSGNIIIEGNGTSDDAEIDISGSGSYTGESMKIVKADISISGSGNCNCNVTGDLAASVSGSGNVSYLGNPKLDAHVSGSGHVRSK
jgi:hypothetical protein